MKNVLQPLAKSVLIPLGLRAVDTGIHKEILGSGTTTLIRSNEEMVGFMKIVKYLEDPGLLLKGVCETIQNEATKEKGGFLYMLLGILGASVLGNMLTGQGIDRARDGIIRAGNGSLKNKDFLMPPHPLTNLETQSYSQNEPKFNGVYSRENLLDKIKDEACVTNLDEYADIGTYWIALYSNGNTITYFDSFEVEHFPKEIKKFIEGSSFKGSAIATNIFIIQAYDSVMCGYFCIGFINYVLKGKSLTDFTKLFLQNNFEEP